MAPVVANDDKVAVERPEPLIRYQFTCTAADGSLIGKFSSLEEVWASTRYMHITDCQVDYVGSGPHVLTPEERAAVNAAIAAGAPSGQESALCLLIIKACTRTDHRTLSASLAGYGIPVVKGALTLAPLAPQAAQLTRWLKTAAPGQS
ncbi:hypothetical protein V3C41_15675 [Paenarthrobacter nicotinovorans]|uniref:Uncharacterized protein n=1 Tax=Paenarthrobacter nicotinovorans TaxID=29320 RepID=A0ABV0GV69_PAENI|nr:MULTISPECIES: hypothetical protein [Micrococcaceae]